MKSVTLLILFVFSVVANIDAQADVQRNFFDLQREMNQYYKDNPGVKGEKVWRRKEWFLEPRLYPSGEMQNLTLKTIKAHHAYLSKHPNTRATHGQWSELGPYNISEEPHVGVIGIGRLNSILIHPTDANIIYVGSSNGGIWKTTNGGIGWNNVSPDLPMLSISDLEMDPNNPLVVYALTGDGDPALPPDDPLVNSEVSGIGVIKSSDGGNTWYPTGFSFENTGSLIPNAFAIHPTNGDIQFVAAKNGIYKTTDSWNTYDTVLELSLSDGAYDIEFHPTNPMKMYSSGVNWIRRSVDGGQSWLLVSDPDFVVMETTFRVELAVTPDLPSAVYAIAGGGGSKITKAVFKTVTEALNNTWTIQDSSTELIAGQSYYNLSMAVKDTDDRDVFVGGVFPWRSLNSSGTTGSWEFLFEDDIHADIHDMVYGDGVLYVASDGGLYKSLDDGTSWIHLFQGLAITEIYRIAGTSQDPGLYYCGTQDNGTLKRNGSTTFTNVLSSDGTTCQINYLNSDTVYASSVNANMFRSFDGFATRENMLVPGGQGGWIAPMEIDPVDPSVIFVGKDSIYRSDNYGDPGSWVYLGMPSGFVVNCLEQGTSNRSRICVSSGENLYRTDIALANPGPAIWTNITNGLPDNFITGIAINPLDANEVYVSFSGYSMGNKVYKSNSSGTPGSWTNISGSLPNVPVNCIVFHNNGSNGLYVGTDIGVFYRDDTLSDWIFYSNSLPVAIVSDLYINTGSNKIVAGTYGRGMWQADLYNGCDAILILGSGAIGGHRRYSVSNWITSAHDYNPDLGTNVHYSAGNFIDLKLGFEVSGLGFFEGKIGPCPPEYDEPLTAPVNQGKPFYFTKHALARLEKVD